MSIFLSTRVKFYTIAKAMCFEEDSEWFSDLFSYFLFDLICNFRHSKDGTEIIFKSRHKWTVAKPDYLEQIEQTQNLKNASVRISTTNKVAILPNTAIGLS